MASRRLADQDQFPELQYKAASSSSLRSSKLWRGRGGRLTSQIAAAGAVFLVDDPQGVAQQQIQIGIRVDGEDLV